MTTVRQNDTDLPPFPRRKRPLDDLERSIIHTLARGGQTPARIVEKLAEKGFVRTEVAVQNSMIFLQARRERRQASAQEEAARAQVEAAARREPPRSSRGISHPDFPGVTLPRLSIQAGCQSVPEAWGR